MHVLFIVNAMDQQLANDQVNLASARYRAIIPARELAKLGIRTELRSFAHMLRPDFTCDADLVVLQQPKAQIATALPMAAVYRRNIDKLQQNGRRLMLEISDFKLGLVRERELQVHIGAEQAQFYRSVIEELHRRSQAFVVPTETLGGLLADHGIPGHAIHTIPDPIEVRHGMPRFAPPRPLRLLWFGTFGNHLVVMKQFLEQDLDRIAAVTPFQLTLLCEPLAPTTLRGLAGSAPDRHEIRTDLWSVPALESALEACDMVVLPFSQTQESVGKSNNRALQALYAGRFVAAHPIGSYRELADFCSISTDFAGSIAAALADPTGTFDRIRHGQDYVTQRYSPAQIGRRWADVITAVQERV